MHCVFRDFAALPSWNNQDSGSVKFLNNVLPIVVLPLSYVLFLRIALKMFCCPTKKAIFQPTIPETWQEFFYTTL